MLKTIWVFDTVVLSNFLIADSTSILEKRYHGKGFITSEVYNEISAGMSMIKSLEKVESLIISGILSVCHLNKDEQTHFKDTISFLGKGEASCIAFAKSRKAVVVTDDRTARKQCSNVNVPVTGTIGILKASVLDGLINEKEADKILSKMIKAGFYSPVNSISNIV